MVKRSKPTQIVLTAIFLIFMLLSFVVIAAVSIEYETNAKNVLLFESDSNMKFTEYEFPATPPFPERPYSHETSQLAVDSSVWTQYNRTAVPIGNNTWAMSLNDTNHEVNYCRIVIDLPELSEWIVSSLNFTMTLNGDTDVLLGASFTHSPIVLISDSTVGTLVYSDTLSGLELEENIALDIEDSLRIYDISQNPGIKTALEFFFFDTGSYDWIGWGLEFTVEIYGEKITGWSINDTMNVVKISFGTGFIALAVVMTDGVDIGGYVKNLPKRKR